MKHRIFRRKDEYFSAVRSFSDLNELPEPERGIVAMLDACDKHDLPGIGRRFENDMPFDSVYDYYLLDSEQQPT